MFRIYRTLIITWFAQNLTYRFALLIWLIGFMLEPVVYLVVWITVARSKGGHVGGFAESDLAVYFTMAMLMNHLTFDWHFFEMEPRIRNGSFSPLLLRPLHPIHSDLADNIVYKLMTFPFMFLAATALYFFYRPEIKIELWAAALFVPALLMGFALRFILEWTIGLTAFWTTRVQALITVYATAAIFLSGRMSPLSLLPPAVQSFARVLPFRLWNSFPVELLLGRMTPEEALNNMAQQVVWFVAFLLLLKFVWARGLKRFSAVGA